MGYIHIGNLTDTEQEQFLGTISSRSHYFTQTRRSEKKKPFKQLACSWFTQITWASLQRIYSHSSHNGLYKCARAVFHVGSLRDGTNVVMAGWNSLEAINLRHYSLCWALYHSSAVQCISEQITWKLTQIFLHNPQQHLWLGAASPRAKVFHVQMKLWK